jgi:hypothetical protein
MRQKIMKCGFIGGFILFIWSAAAWTILPWQKGQFKSFSSQKSMRYAFKDNAPESGLYTVPGMNASDREEAKMEMQEGPYVFAAVSANGKTSGMVASTVQGLILKIVLACLVAWMMFHLKVHDFNHSVKFITVVGLLIGLASTLPYVIWFGFPGTFAISGILESIIGWFFAGLGMARMSHRHG